MFCALSGEAPVVPVLSRISGNVFEKRLLDSYIAENKKDPVTGEEMGPEDVVEIKASRVVRPRPPNATSIPSLLSIFQNEWDALALETYHLKRQLHQTRQELSTALYQHDAACRVIARISQERDEAREALSKVSENMSLPVAQPMEIDGDQPIPTVIVDIVKETLQEESAKRKKRKVPENWTTAEQLSGLKQHKATKANLKNLELPGAASSGVLNASHPSKQFEIIGAGSEWYITSNEQEQYRSHQDSVITSLAIHPDGHLLALGCEDGAVRMFHLLEGKVATSFGPAKGPISCVSFSENGYWLAVASEAESVVAIWHLAKESIVAELEVGENSRAAAWDPSGLYLACAGPGGVKVWTYAKAGKQWSPSFQATGDYTQLAWLPNAKGLVAAGARAQSTFSL